MMIYEIVELAWVGFEVIQLMLSIAPNRVIQIVFLLVNHTKSLIGIVDI
jgi:hypothetical protein